MFLYRLQGTIASTKYVDRWKKKSRTRQKITVKFTHLVATLFIYPRTLVILVAIIKIISVITFTSGSFTWVICHLSFLFFVCCSVIIGWNIDMKICSNKRTGKPWFDQVFAKVQQRYSAVLSIFSKPRRLSERWCKSSFL